MTRRDPPLSSDLRLTKELRLAVAICAEVMANEETAITEALRDPYRRRKLKQCVSELETQLEAIRDAA